MKPEFDNPLYNFHPWVHHWETAANELPLEGLVALREAMLQRSAEICRRRICISADDDPIDKEDVEPCQACPIAYALWKGLRLNTIKEVLDQIATLNLNEEGIAARRFMAYWDGCTADPEVDWEQFLEVLTWSIKCRGGEVEEEEFTTAVSRR